MNERNEETINVNVPLPHLRAFAMKHIERLYKARSYDAVKKDWLAHLPGTKCTTSAGTTTIRDNNIPSTKMGCIKEMVDKCWWVVHSTQDFTQFLSKAVGIISRWWLEQRKKMFRKPTKSASHKRVVE